MRQAAKAALQIGADIVIILQFGDRRSGSAAVAASLSGAATGRAVLAGCIGPPNVPSLPSGFLCSAPWRPGRCASERRANSVSLWDRVRSYEVGPETIPRSPGNAIGTKLVPRSSWSMLWQVLTPLRNQMTPTGRNIPTALNTFTVTASEKSAF